jgi:Dolichyl-phosphate-mannose-protein mannosyltransferase
MNMVGPANRRRLVVLSLLIVGVGMFVAIYGKDFLTLGPWGPGPLIALAIAAIAVGWLWPANHSRFPSRWKWSSVAAAVAAVAYLLATAWQQHRQLTPLLHDEFSYLIQAHQLAHGRLWMPSHPLAAFFDSFQLIVHPIYASIYFPGTALLYVPGIWLHLPAWVTSIAIAGAVIFLLHRIASELINSPAAWLAVLLLICCPIFRTLSVMTMAQLPLLLYVLLSVLAWMRWANSERLRWAVLLGASLGLAFITRPLDAVCFAVPISIAAAMKLPKQQKRASFAAAIVISAAPFLCIQLIANRGITGHWLETPFRLYADADYPGTALGFREVDPAARPVSSLPQKQKLYVEKTLPLIEQHQLQFLPKILFRRTQRTLSLEAATPFPLLAILLPVALVSRRRAVLAPVLLFVGLYAFYVFFFPHYVIVVAPAIIGGILIGAEQLATVHSKIRAGLCLFIAILAIAALPQLDPAIQDKMFDAPLMQAVNTKLAGLGEPSIVLFAYSAARNVDEEPVYNADVAWPDEAHIIRAHDLGERNSELFRYYADRQPQRRVYRFDEADYSLTFLGTASELAYNHR